MTSFDERLLQSDPVPSGSYVPADYSAMVARVAAVRVARRDPQWRAFRARVGSAVAATSLLTGLGVAALGTAGSSLPVLGFAAAGHQKAAGSPSAQFMAINPNASWQFNGAGAFSHAPGSATAYTLSGPTDGAAALGRVASALGLDIGVPTSTDAGQSFSATGAAYSGWLVQNGGYASWGIDSSAAGGTVSSSTGAASSAASSLTSEALRLAGAITDLQLGTPSATTFTGDVATNDQVDVNVPVLVQGNVTDFSFDFIFASDASLVSASGILATVTAAGDYPILSPADGVGQISAQMALASTFGGGVVPMGAESSTSTSVPSVPPVTTGPGGTSPTTAPGASSGSSGASPGSPPVTDPTPPPTDTTPTTVPAPTVVDLTDVSLQYGVFAMASGATMLLPVYVYTGTVAGNGGYQVSFRVVPVDPAYLDLAIVQGPIRY